MPDRNGYSTDVPVETMRLLFQTPFYRVEARASEDPEWLGNDVIFDDYFIAAGWALALLRRRTYLEAVRVVPATVPPALEAALGAA